MKIHQLAMGARFVFEGEEYVKSGPLVATGKAGSRLIPRSAVLQPIGDPASMPDDAPDATVARNAVLDALDAFCARCEPLVDESGRAELDEARRAFLKAIS